jgi:two-component system, chemotaxis family, chemotaxis protein CheY
MPDGTLTVLYAEDHKIVADAVKETLEEEGLRVVLCSDGAVALQRIAGDARYDLLVLDNHLPNVNGLELVRYTRQLPHRKTIPIIMLSADECPNEAYRNGVNVFLKKPEGVKLLVKFVNQLLARL